MKDIHKQLKNKSILLCPWGVDLKTNYQCRDWIPLFKKLFGRVIIFSPRSFYYKYGKDIMNKSFLNLVEKEKPDYILFTLSYEEFEIDTLLKVKELSPKTKVMNLFGDDEWRYDDWSRHYALFFDYNFSSEYDVNDYYKDGITNVRFLHGISENYFKPLKLKKKFDVTFIGAPIADRYDYIKYLKDNGIKLNLFGAGWHKYKDLEGIYGGFLDSEDFIKVINESKINISFSKGAIPGSKGGQLKGRIFEVPSCKSFLLIEHFPQIIDFFRNKGETKKILFKDKKELLYKIKYYLKNEKERERLENSFYHYVLKNYTWEAQFIDFFSKALNHKINFESIGLRELAKNVVEIKTEEMDNIEKLKEKLKDAHYISFNNGSTNLKYKNHFLLSALEKSGKDIGCCDYYVHSNSLGDYLLFNTKKVLHTVSREDFNKLINISQLMVKKDFFLNNIDKFNQALESGFDFVNEKNTIFVSIPLVRIKHINKINYESFVKAFNMRFIDKLYSLILQKNIFYSFYPYKLIIGSFLKGEIFILKYIYEFAKNKETWDKLKK